MKKNILKIIKLLWETNPRYVICLILSAFLRGVLPTINVYLVKLLIDEIISITVNKFEENNILLFLGGLLILGIINIVLSSVYSLFQEIMGNLLVKKVNVLIIEKAGELEFSYFENPVYYDLLQRARNEAGFRPLGVLNQILSIFSTSISLLSIFSVLLVFNFQILLILIFTTIPAIFIKSYYGKELFRILNLRTPEVRKMGYYLSLLSTEQSVKEIRLYGLTELLSKRYKNLISKFIKNDTTLSVKRQLADIGLSILSLLGYYGCYGYVILETIKLNISIGDLTLYSGLFSQLQSNLTTLLGNLSSIYESTLFIENLFSFLNLKPKKFSKEKKQINIAQVPKKWRLGISLKNVSFKYPDSNRMILNNINMEIKPGEKIALVGENGSGKTTLVKLITRLYNPTKGQITLDGVDLHHYDLSEFYKSTGVIFQDFMKYNLTVNENIGFGNIEHFQNEEKIISSSKISGAHCFVSKLPQGYETCLGRLLVQGEQLSIGEWQKLALARTFMRDSNLLILDEPTASLDIKSEYEIFNMINKLCKDKSVILISHRFNTVRMADKIFVLDNGKIAESGNHNHLMNINGLYSKLFLMQAQNYL